MQCDLAQFPDQEYSTFKLVAQSKKKGSVAHRLYNFFNA